MKLVLITDEYYDKAIHLWREHFLPHEPLSKAVNLEWSDLVKAYVSGILQQHLSIMFLDEITDEPVAFRLISFTSRNDKIDLESDTPLNIQDMKQYLDYCDEQAQFFDHYGINEAFRFVALVVADKYKRRGLATQIFHAAIDLVRNFGFPEVCIKGEGSSNYSKKIYDREGFDTLYENVYDTWEVDGRRPFTNTGEHKSVKIYGRVVQQNEKV